MLRIATAITRNNFTAWINSKSNPRMGIRQWVINNYQFVTKEVLEANESFRIKTGIGESIVGDRIDDKSCFSPVEIAELKRSLAAVRRDQADLGMRIYYNWSTDLDAYYSNASPAPDGKCTWPFTRADIQVDGSIILCQVGKKIGKSDR